jgi:restriction endonuclease Mrr
MRIVAIRIPGDDELMPAVLRALHEAGGSATIAEINSSAAKLLELPEKAWEIEIAHGKGGSLLAYRLRWTRTALKKAGLISNPSRGVWTLVNPDLDVATVDSRAIMKSSRRAPDANTAPDS